MSLRSAAPHHGWECFISVTHRIPMHVMFPGSKGNEINYKICNKKYVCIASSSLPLSANMVSSRITQMRSLPQMNFLQYPLRHQSHNINLKEKKKFQEIVIYRRCLLRFSKAILEGDSSLSVRSGLWFTFGSSGHQTTMNHLLCTTS